MKEEDRVREEARYIFSMESCQRCGTERFNQYDDCDSCLIDQILALIEEATHQAKMDSFDKGFKSGLHHADDRLEEAKMEERERIIEYVEKYVLCRGSGNNVFLNGAPYEAGSYWQALKEKL